MMKLTAKFSIKLLPGLALWGAFFSLAACASHHEVEEINTLDNVPVNIQFNDDGCPDLVTPEDFLVTTSKRVVWQSVDSKGNPVDMRYEIYFDPFKGQPLKSNPNGRLRSPPFDSDAPATSGAGGIEYKYSVVGEKCKHAPYDPRFRLRK